MPRVYVIESDQPNGFATGRNTHHTALAVTSGLLQTLPRQELPGVLAYEFAHVRNVIRTT
jgi:heat shock protein HtpX